MAFAYYTIFRTLNDTRYEILRGTFSPNSRKAKKAEIFQYQILYFYSLRHETNVYPLFRYFRVDFSRACKCFKIRSLLIALIGIDLIHSIFTGFYSSDRCRRSIIYRPLGSCHALTSPVIALCKFILFSPGRSCNFFTLYTCFNTVVIQLTRQPCN